MARPYYWLSAFGIDGFTTVRAVFGMPRVIVDYLRLRMQNRARRAGFRIRLTAPCPADRWAQAGTASGHYFHQDLLVARRIHERGPRRHIDIGSRIDGFVAHLAVFREIEVLDVRPLPSVHNVTSRQCDLSELPADLEASSDSVSCLHALEHFGLGRYGDRLDVHGHLKGFDAIQRIVEPDGILYLSVPIGPERVEFNGHRVLAVSTMLDLARPAFDLVSFSYVDDAGALHEDADVTPDIVAANAGCHYGCGIFELRKHRHPLAPPGGMAVVSS